MKFGCFFIITQRLRQLALLIETFGSMLDGHVPHFRPSSDNWEFPKTKPVDLTASGTSESFLYVPVLSVDNTVRFLCYDLLACCSGAIH